MDSTANYLSAKMMTKRQRKILSAIIREFMQTAEPVGSLSIAENHDIKVSPATIRNEMAELSRQGFIEKEHSSAGRFPTSLGYRFYINDLMEEEEIPQVEELEIGRRIFAQRFAKERLVKQAVDVLSEVTRNVAVAVLNDTIFSAGTADLLRYAEMQDLEKLREILIILENHQILYSMFQRVRGEGERNVKILIGEETGINSFHSCGVVFNDFRVHQGEQGVLAVIGPARMNYSRVVPMVKIVSEKLNNVVFGW